MSFNMHAAVSPMRHEVIAKPKPVYQPSGAQICFEVSNDELITDKLEASTPPLFLVPSTEEAGEEGSFQIQIRATVSTIFFQADV